MPESVPVSVWSGSFRVFGVEMKCHVLDDGHRVIEEESVKTFFDVLAGRTGDPSDEGDLQRFSRWARGIDS